MRVVQGRAILAAGQRAKGFLGIVNVTLRLICLPKNLMRKSSDALQGSKKGYNGRVPSGEREGGEADEDNTRSCMKLQMK